MQSNFIKEVQQRGSLLYTSWSLFGAIITTSNLNNNNIGLEKFGGAIVGGITSIIICKTLTESAFAYDSRLGTIVTLSLAPVAALGITITFSRGASDALKFAGDLVLLHGEKAINQAIEIATETCVELYYYTIGVTSSDFFSL